jgi:nucleoside-diphosphate-sugar epimerase
MKVLITGSSGFIGTHLTKKMKKEGFKVVTFDIKENKSNDVRNFKTLLEKSKGCDVIVHLAALCIDSESLEKPYEYFSTNVLGTLNALEVARRIKVKKFLFASSAGIGKRTPYSLSKLLGEELCMFYNKHYNVPTYILRIYNVYGPGNEKGVIYNFVKRALKNKPIIINFDGKQERDFIHVDDVVKSIILLLRKKYKPGIYEIGTGKSIKIIDLAKLIISLTDSKSKIVFRKPNIEEVKISRAKEPIIKEYKPLRDRIRETLDWYKKLKH